MLGYLFLSKFKKLTESFKYIDVNNINGINGINMKGQSILGFLITWGWVILIILVILAVLWYYIAYDPCDWDKYSEACLKQKGSPYVIVAPGTPPTPEPQVPKYLPLGDLLEENWGDVTLLPSSYNMHFDPIPIDIYETGTGKEICDKINETRTICYEEKFIKEYYIVGIDVNFPTGDKYAGYCWFDIEYTNLNGKPNLNVYWYEDKPFDLEFRDHKEFEIYCSLLARYL